MAAQRVGLVSHSESGYHRMLVDRRIRFEYTKCGRGDFLIRKEEVADSKISEYVWTGSKLPLERLGSLRKPRRQRQRQSR